MIVIDKLIREYIRVNDRFWMSDLRILVNVKNTYNGRSHNRIKSIIRRMKEDGLLRSVDTGRLRDMLYEKVNLGVGEDFKISKL